MVYGKSTDNIVQSPVSFSVAMSIIPKMCH